jgi:hypothetical protein
VLEEDDVHSGVALQNTNKFRSAIAPKPDDANTAPF